MIYISCKQIIELHDALVKKFGGLYGIRDVNLLESAAACPMMAAFGEDFYKSVYDKVAAYLFFISKNHPFLDGNKRTATATALAFLRANGESPQYDVDAFMEFVVSVAEGKADLQTASRYFKKNMFLTQQKQPTAA